MNPLTSEVGQDPYSWFIRQIPLLLLLYVLPFVFLAWWKRIYPHWPLIAALAAVSALTLVLLVNVEAVVLVLLLDALVALLATSDLLTLPPRSSFQCRRETTRIASLRQNHRVQLTITNPSPWERVVALRDDLPQEFLATPDQFTLRLAPRSRASLHYDFKAERRGAFSLHAVYLRARSRWGLWQRLLSYPAESEIHVYPDMQQLAQYAVLARTNRLSLVGVKRTRKIGTDNEFERLRDYTLDDNYKHLDWRSTARRSKLTVRDFQSSQSQRIVFLLDCGRMMTNLSGGISLLDHACNAMLMLAYVALKQGDSVGLLCFSDTVHAYIPPQGGMKQTNHLLHAVFDRFPKLVESRYDQAFLYLNRHCKKRTLVVLITNVIDEVNALQMHNYLSNLVGHHLPLGILLRDRELFAAAEVEHPTGEALFRAAAAAEILSWRHQVLRNLEHSGVLTLDVFPDEMTAPLINAYLRAKARHLL